MDPITQGALGASAALGFRLRKQMTKTEVALTATAGWIGGMAPDLDVLIRSSSDPLLAVEFHRHFTHSLFFIPVGGTIVGLFVMSMLFLKRRWGPSVTSDRFWSWPILIAALIGYATHGLLDACTSYGTQLLWPFSSLRVAWNNVGIIDPVPTLLWIVSIVFAFRLPKMVRPVRKVQVLFALGIVYLSIGVLQRERASALQAKLIEDRGLTVEAVDRRVVKPTVLQIFLWRSIYQHEGRYFTDGIYVGLTDHRFYPGESVAVLSRPSKEPTTRFEKDLKRFDWFSDGWLAEMPNSPEGPSRIGDMRYAFLPQEIRPLWGIEFKPETPEEPVLFRNFRELRAGDASCYFRMMGGFACN